jgi:hypothetical protein
MWEKVAQEGIADTSQAIGPGIEAGDTVYAEAQNLGLHPFEPVECDLVGRDLAGSYGRPGQGEKGQDYVTLSAVVAQADQTPIVALQPKIRGKLSDCRCHVVLVVCHVCFASR